MPDHRSKFLPLSRFKIDLSSLRVRLLMRVWVSLLILATLIAIVQYQTLNLFLLKGQEQSLQGELAFFTAQEYEKWLTDRQSPPKFDLDLNQGTEVFLFTNNAQFKWVFAHKEVNNQAMPARAKLIQNQLINSKPLAVKRFVLNPKNGERILLLIKPVFANNQKSPLGYAVITSSLASIDNILKNQVRTSIFYVLFVLLLGSIASFWVLRRPLQPLETISHISEQIAAGHYDLRIPITSDSASEIKYLSNALNHMLETLQHALTKEREAKEEMKRFIADASHELRTPLTSIRGFLEILLKGHTRDADALHSVHQTMLVETERLISLTENLLTLNRINAKSVDPNHENHVLSPVESINELTLLLQSLAKSRTVNVKCSVSELPLTSEELKQILYNLVHNAVRHTTDSGHIQVALDKDESGYLITVRDDGEGISAEDLPHVFERFYRGNRARDKRRGEGAGLGLAIVGDIVKLHHGTIKVDSTLGKGTVFSIRFPNY
ncbi:sensor histidine kinase [Desulfitobacterium sp. Sab5]|uniref:sensor histidine kinase n=1 Tax=Desulfitobacterium nosdiversum TaxID=3375356 RepID=UPI003CFB53B4